MVHSTLYPALKLARPMPEKMHPFIAEAMKRSVGLFENPRHFKRLQRVHWSRSKKYSGEARRGAPCGQRRRERREIHSKLAAVMMLRWDRRTLRVGTQRSDGSCVGITVKTLAGWIGASRWRVERALTDFYDVGWATSDQPREKKPDGRWVGFPSIRCLTVDFFRALGLHVKLRIARRQAYQRWKAEQRGGASGADASTRSPEARAQADLFDANETRRFFAALVELRRERPGLSSDELEALAHERLRGPPGGRPPPSST